MWSVTLQKQEYTWLQLEFLAVPKPNEKLKTAATKQSSRDTDKLIF